jgi:hypothetical protein
MDDPSSVQRIEASRDVDEGRDELIRREYPTLGSSEVIREGATVTQVHDEKWFRACDGATRRDIVNGHHVRMADRGEHSRFALESSGDERVRRVVGEEDLHCDVAIEPKVAGPKDRGEPTRPDPRVEPVAAGQPLPNARHAPRVPDALAEPRSHLRLQAVPLRRDTYRARPMPKGSPR